MYGIYIDSLRYSNDRFQEKKIDLNMNIVSHTIWIRYIYRKQTIKR